MHVSNSTLNNSKGRYRHHRTPCSEHRQHVFLARRVAPVLGLHIWTRTRAAMTPPSPLLGEVPKRSSANLAATSFARRKLIDPYMLFFEFGRTFPRNCVAILLTQGPYGSGKTAIHITVMACSSHKLSRIHTQPVLMP